jgi:type IV pilus assembly protein PilB
MDPLQALQERGGVDEAFILEAERMVSETGELYDSVFIKLGMDENEVRTFMADFYQVPPFAIPEGFSVKQEVLSYISESAAVHYRAVPLMIDDEVLLIGSNNPDNLQMREALNFISTKSNIPYRLVYMLDKDIARVLNFYSNLEGDVVDALETIETELDAEIAASLEETAEQTKESLEHIEEDAPVTKIVATILRYAVDGSASDIHIEPSPAEVGVRFRVDGSLARSLTLPKNVHMAVVARVKILSSMRLDERRRPQDGRFSATFDDRKIDFRVSVLPTNHGEKVVMRILDTSQGMKSLEQSGISSFNMELIRRVVQEPYGIILISGPTGSGKSTTLRAMIQELDTLSKNILSLEDPV